MFTFVLGLFVGAVGTALVIKNNLKRAEKAWADADGMLELAKALVEQARALKNRLNL
jgi:hypothetical protein